MGIHDNLGLSCQMHQNNTKQIEAKYLSKDPSYTIARFCPLIFFVILKKTCLSYLFQEKVKMRQ